MQTDTASGRSSPAHFAQIDILKGLAIIAVIIAHTAPLTVLVPYPTAGHLAYGIPLSVTASTLLDLLDGLAVPIFLVLMGVTATLSFIRRGHVSFKDCYSLNYFSRRFLRFYVPYVIFLIAAIFVYLYETWAVGYKANFNVLTLAGGLPASFGAGGYFVPVIFEFVLIFPLLFYIFKKSQVLLLVLCFATTFVFASLFGYLHIISTYAYDRCVLRFLPAIAIGMWIAGDFELFSSDSRFSELHSKRHGLYLSCGLIGITLIFLTRLRIYSEILIHSPWNVVLARLSPFRFIYAAVPVILGIRYLPKRTTNRFWSSLSVVGIASYHIFLVQILYFSLFYHLRLTKLLLWYPESHSTAALSIVVFLGNIAVCTILGVLFYYGTNKLESRLKHLF